MQLSQRTWRTTIHLRSALLLVTTAAMLAACGDSSLSPSAQRGAPLDRPVLDKKVGSTTITYTPKHSVYANVGDKNVLYIPADGICDLASSYGVDQWDKPCTALTHPLKITATSWLDANGHPYIQFEPALRFVPNKWAVLYIRDASATLDLSVRITYCPNSGSCIDESKTDPSLATFHWPGGVYRRIKHFSGYNVAAGFDEEPVRDASYMRSAESSSASMDRGRRSGYMVVSGLEVPREVIDMIPEPHVDNQQ